MTPQQWRQTGNYFQYINHRVFYRNSEKDAPILLLLHGFPSASWDWHKIWDKLAENFHLIAPDFIGYGFSDKPVDYRYSILDQADLCERLLRKHQLKNVHLLAHDYGNSVAQELMIRHLSKDLSFTIESVCVLNGGLFIEAQKPRIIQKLLLSPIGFLLNPLLTKERLRSNFKAIFGPNTPPTEEEIGHFFDLINHNNGRRVLHLVIRYLQERKKYRDRWVMALQKFQPLRLISGPEDPVSGRNINKRFRELVPNPDIVELRGIGHYPQVEAPDQVLQHFLAFQQLK